MDKNALEKKLFAHLEKESLVLTPTNVGFALEIDASDAVSLMDELVAEEKLERVSGEGAGATYKRVGHATYETTPGAVSVGRAKSAKALYHLLFNVFIPGLGSLIYGRIFLLLVTAALFWGGIAMIVMFDDWSKLYAIWMLVGAWVISFFGSIYYYAKDPWGAKTDK